MSRKKSGSGIEDEQESYEWEDEAESSESGKDKGIGDILKRVISVGVGSAFMTEEAVKKAISDLPLPKDMLSGLLQNAKQAKSDFMDTLKEEIREKFDKVDPAKLVDELAERYDIEVKATVKFKKKAQAEDEPK